MNSAKAIEGITLSSFSFQENSYILSVLSKECGRIKCVTKCTKKSSMRSLGPILGVEMQVIPSDKELWKCKDCIVTTSYPALRSSLESLRYAVQVTDLLDKLLPLHHNVEHIYTLYSQFLAKTPNLKAACIFLESVMILEGMLEKAKDPELHDLGYYNTLIHKIR